LPSKVFIQYDTYCAPQKYPFLQNTSLSLNVYEFIRNFTFFNIGEPINPLENDNDLYNYVKFIIQGTRLKGKITINDFLNENIDINDNPQILCIHLKL